MQRSSYEVWTAIATPFSDNGFVDYSAWEKMLSLQKDANITGIVIAGSTGEAATLSVEEKLSLIKKAKAFCGSSLQIMAGVGGNSTDQTLELSKLACDAGADSLLIVTPAYTKPNFSGLYKHYELLAKGVKKPICIYHIPGRTAQKLSSQEILKLLEIDGIDSVKESSSDFSLFTNICSNSSKIFYSGDDITYLPSLAIGAHGVISVVSNLFPKALKRLGDAFFEKDFERAYEMHKILLPMMNVLFCETNPTPLKAALSMLGIAKNRLRLPLDTVSDANFKMIAESTLKVQAQLESMSLI